MSKLKKLLNELTLFEKILIVSSLLVVVLVFVFLPNKNWLMFVQTLIGIIVVFLYSVGFVFAPYIGLVSDAMYVVIAILQKFYGEAIIYVVLMIPICILQIFQWSKNKQKDNEMLVEVGKITKKEVTIIVFAAVAITIASYFFLKLLNTNELIVSTISVTTSLVACYLMVRRSPYYAIIFVLNDVVLIVLWGLSVASGGISNLPMCIGFVSYLANDLYGFVNWKRRERKEEVQEKV